MNIAICGLLRSGKDSVAAYLCANYGYSRFAFGDGLKDVCRRLYPEEFVDGRKPRALLQGFGQMARSFGDGNVWVNECFRRIGGAAVDCENDNGNYAYPFRAVVTDIRQPNELERCRAEGYVIIRVNCPEKLRFLRAQSAGDTFSFADLQHDTETHVDTFAVDYDINNSGSLAELHVQINAVMEAVG
jgi:dephospho-CoA kinase